MAIEARHRRLARRLGNLFRTALGRPPRSVVAYDLSEHADILGDPADFFVDEHEGVYRVVRHSDGVVVAVLRPNGTLGPFVTKTVFMLIDPRRLSPWPRSRSI